MKLEELTIEVVSKAVGIYVNLAYGGGNRPRRMPDLSLPPDAGPEDVLDLFQKEEVDEEGRRVRYTMRLGNRNYPFMKLVLQEHLVAGEFYFAVDTHDDMDVKPDYPDYEQWMVVRRFNRKLKQEIEAQFAAEGLPTAATLRHIAVQREASGVGTGRPTILVVDDEEDLADTVEALLEAKGYRVHKAGDGGQALKLAEEIHPDLVLLDYELPETDGLEIIAALRRNERTRDIPVLLSTASRISIEDVRKADGFLAKPFHEDLLYEMVGRLMRTRKEVR